jgi:hypothetical protein
LLGGFSCLADHEHENEHDYDYDYERASHRRRDSTAFACTPPARECFRSNFVKAGHSFSFSAFQQFPPTDTVRETPIPV